MTENQLVAKLSKSQADHTIKLIRLVYQICTRRIFHYTQFCMHLLQYG